MSEPRRCQHLDQSAIACERLARWRVTPEREEPELACDRHVVAALWSDQPNTVEAIDPQEMGP